MFGKSLFPKCLFCIKDWMLQILSYWLKMLGESLSQKKCLFYIKKIEYYKCYLVMAGGGGSVYDTTEFFLNFDLHYLFNYSNYC